MKNYEAIYWNVRNKVLDYALYTNESMTTLSRLWLALDFRATVNGNLEKIRKGDAAILELLDQAEKAIEDLIPLESPKQKYDIWEGHDVPAAIGEARCAYDMDLACLSDDSGFRPFINDYRLADPADAKGTLFAIPSIRAGLPETDEIAEIFNSRGFNVFTVEPRMNKLGDKGYAELCIDVQRAIRYVRHNAEKFRIDPNKFIALAGSKGNFSHPMSFNFFDLGPSAFIKSIGSDLPGYVEDEIDHELSTLCTCLQNYGSVGICGMHKPFTDEVILNSRIYNEKYMKQGLYFPDIAVTTGNLDFDAQNVPAFLAGMVSYSNREDKLYPIAYEVHIMNDVPHGFGSAKSYRNLTAQWDELAVFAEDSINRKNS